MNKSKFFTLNLRDFIKGSVIAVLTGIGTALALPDRTLKNIGITALIAFISYLAKNLFTNNNDELLKSDKT